VAVTKFLLFGVPFHPEIKAPIVEVDGNGVVLQQSWSDDGGGPMIEFQKIEYRRIGYKDCLVRPRSIADVNPKSVNSLAIMTP
jgi:hypothetical protein